MVRINLRRGRKPLGLHAGRLSMGHRHELWAPMLELWRVIGGRRIPAGKLHHIGYQATPDIAAPLCSAGGGPYGRIVWILHDLPRPPLPVCASCLHKKREP
jgi:hypothetical protein